MTGALEEAATYLAYPYPGKYWAGSMGRVGGKPPHQTKWRSNADSR
jgi:hypothetical protein